MCATFIACLGLYASLAECTRRKRQDQVCTAERYYELFERVPDECYTALTNIYSSCGRQCESVVCSETCVRSIHDFEAECYDNPAWEVLCSRNEGGTPCYDTVVDPVEEVEGDLFYACYNYSTDFCPDKCGTQLAEDNRDAGCCLYTYIAAFYGLQDITEFWNDCNVDTPNLCTSLFTGKLIKVTGSSQMTVTSIFSVLVATLLMASTSLD